MVKGGDLNSNPSFMAHFLKQKNRSYQVSFANEVFPSEYADKEQDRRNAPGHANHRDHLVSGSPCPILGSNLDGTEPVNGDQ